MPTSHQFSEEAKAKAVEMYLDGAKTEDIHQETGVARPSLYLLLRQRGINPNRQRESRYIPGLDASAILVQLRDAQTQLGTARAENEHLRRELDLARQRIGILEAELEELGEPVG